jgi:hypothetical protein
LATPNADPAFVIERFSGKTTQMNQRIFEGDIVRGTINQHCGGKWRNIESIDPALQNKMTWAWNYKEKEFEDVVVFDCFELTFKVKGYRLAEFRNLSVTGNIHENDLQY